MTPWRSKQVPNGFLWIWVSADFQGFAGVIHSIEAAHFQLRIDRLRVEGLAFCCGLVHCEACIFTGCRLLWRRHAAFTVLVAQGISTGCRCGILPTCRSVPISELGDVFTGDVPASLSGQQPLRSDAVCLLGTDCSLPCLGYLATTSVHHGVCLATAFRHGSICPDARAGSVTNRSTAIHRLARKLPCSVDSFGLWGIWHVGGIRNHVPHPGP